MPHKKDFTMQTTIDYLPRICDRLLNKENAIIGCCFGYRMPFYMILNHSVFSSNFYVHAICVFMHK